jgi:hypothetical protein
LGFSEGVILTFRLSCGEKYPLSRNGYMDFL